MNLTRIISIKERIAISPEFKPDERDFILEAINSVVERACSSDLGPGWMPNNPHIAAIDRKSVV